MGRIAALALAFMSFHALADDLELGTIWAKILSPIAVQNNSVESVRRNGFKELETYIGVHGLPAAIPLRVTEILREDLLKKESQYNLNENIRLVALLRLQDEEIRRQAEDLYLLNQMFRGNTLGHVVTVEEIQKDSPKIFALLGPYREKLVRQGLFQSLNSWAMAYAVFDYKKSLEKGVRFSEEQFRIRYAPVAAADESLKSYIFEVARSIERPLEALILDHDMKDAKTLQRALEMSSYLRLKSAVLPERYLQIAESPLKGVDSQAARQLRDAVAVNLLQLAPTDDLVVARIRAIPAEHFSGGYQSRAHILYAIAKKGNASAIEGLAEEFLYKLGHTPTDTDRYSSLGDFDFVSILSQMEWNEKTEQLIDRILTYSESHFQNTGSSIFNRINLLRERRFARLEATGDLNDPSHAKAFLERHRDDESKITYLLIQRIHTPYGVEPSEEEMARRSEMGALLHDIILQRMGLSAFTIETMKKARTALNSAEYFNLLAVPDIQVAVSTLANLKRPYQDYGTNHEVESLATLARNILAKVAPQDLIEPVLISVAQLYKDDAARKILSRSKTSSTVVQIFLIEQLKVAAPRASYETDYRPFVMSTLDDLPIQDQHVKDALREMFDSRPKLVEMAKSKGQSLLVAAGILADPESMKTIDQIAIHIAANPTDLRYMRSVMHQALTNALPKKSQPDDDGVYRLNKPGVHAALMPAVQNYFRNFKPDSWDDFPVLAETIRQAASLEMFDDATINEVARLMKKESFTFLARLSTASAVREVRKQAILFIQQTKTNDPTIIHTLVDIAETKTELSDFATTTLGIIARRGDLQPAVAARPDLQYRLVNHAQSRRARKWGEWDCNSILDNLNKPK